LKTEGGLKEEKAEDFEDEHEEAENHQMSFGIGLARSARIEVKDSERKTMSSEQNDADDLLSSLKLNFTKN